MTRSLPPLNPLRAFEATARQGTVSAAAKELSVTHSAVSHQIKVLESTLGVKLFERGAQRLRLTGQGALLLPAITNAFENIAKATAQAQRPSTQGDLSISCPPALLSHWLLPRIHTFTQRFPDIRLTLSSSYDASRIHLPEYDLCILYGDGDWGGCWVKHWAQATLFPVISTTLLNRKPLRSVRDLQDHVILHNKDFREWRAWLRAAEADEIETQGHHHFFSDARLGLDAAIYGQGVALGDHLTTSDMLAKGTLVRPFNRSVPAVDSFYVVCRHESRELPIVEVFIDWLYAVREIDS